MRRTLAATVTLSLLIPVASTLRPAFAHEAPESHGSSSTRGSTGAVTRGPEAGDVHSPNMSLLANVDTGAGGDVAFWGDTAVLSYGWGTGEERTHGFKLLDISNPAKPRQISHFQCTHSSADVSIWGDLVLLSVWGPVEGTSCDGAPNNLFGPQETRFAGIRVVSIANPRKPVQVAAVRVNNELDDPECPTQVGPAGSHTHTLLPDLDHRDAAGKRSPRLLVYTSSSGLCDSTDDIVEVLLRSPQSARVVGSVDTAPANGCHDVTVFPARNLAVCNALVETQIWDITDPINPRILSHIVNPRIEVHHSSAFSWDGDTLVISDERVTSYLTDVCWGGTDAPLGGMWFYDVRDPANPVERGFYQLPQAGVTAGCWAHQFNVVPLDGPRDVLVAGWYGGGTTVVEFTDPSKPVQIGHYISAPANPDRQSFAWASYWYNGRIYANNSVHQGVSRGFDVLTIDHPVFDGARQMSSFNFGTQL